MELRIIILRTAYSLSPLRRGRLVACLGRLKGFSASIRNDVMKALEKDRSRRYESANSFAADVQRYLNDEPVQACPPSAGYRLRKFARRNQGRVAASAGLLFSGVVVACLVIAYYLQSAGRLRQISQGVQEALAGAQTAPHQWKLRGIVRVPLVLPIPTPTPASVARSAGKRFALG
jgi:hypothetical protein